MITVLFKPTENCNANCIYCDGGLKNNRDERMSAALMETVFFRMNEYLTANPEEQIQFVWHGGEALMMGVDFFRKSLDFQQRLCPTTSNRISHCIQSNLTLINQDFIDILRELGITSVGTSYDPIPHTRGIGARVDSESYNKLFMKGIGLLEKNNFGWGIIYVVTRRTLARPERIFNFLTNFKLCGGVNFHAVLIYGEDTRNVAITPEEFADFLGAIFPQWWKFRDRYPDVSPFAELVRNLTNNGLSLGCNDSGDCAFHHIYIGPEGAASHCGRSADWDIIWYGNIQDNTLAELLHNNKRNALLERDKLLPETECKGCNLWHVCHGGCPLDAYAEHGSFAHKSKWCQAKKIFIKKYFEPITQIPVG